MYIYIYIYIQQHHSSPLQQRSNFIQAQALENNNKKKKRLKRKTTQGFDWKGLYLYTYIIHIAFLSVWCICHSLVMSGPYNKVTPVMLGQSRGSNRDPTGTGEVPNSHSSTTSSTFQGSWNPFPGYNANDFYNRMNNPTANRFLRPSSSGTLGGSLAFPVPPPPPMIPPPAAIPPPPMPLFSPVPTGSLNDNKKKRSRNGDISKEEAARRRKRAERFGTPAQSRPVGNGRGVDEEENFANLNAISTKSHKFDKNKRILGRCQNLEKPYLRLTSEPNPETVRPLSVLKKTYNMLMEKYEGQKASYHYLCDQFKSMRQDLRVQILENEFTIKVYQSHARIALENGDIGEFNQCQSRLITLFELPNIKHSCLEEFTSYRILYYILTEDHGAITSLRLKLMTENFSVFKHPLVQQAFQLARTQLVGDYHNFMRIHSSMEGLGKKLVDFFIGKEKLKSLLTICRSYNQVPLEFLQKEFQFQNVESTIDFLSHRGLSQFILVKTQTKGNEYKYLDTKACRPYVIQQYTDPKRINMKSQQ